MSQPTAKEILWLALEIAPEERARLIRAHCGDDDELRGRVEKLLAAHARSDRVFGKTGTSVDGRWQPFGLDLQLAAKGFDAARQPDLEGGDALGPYRIVKKAGAGGFGTVYLAEQREPVARRVALKVLHTGLDSDAARARFEAERQALARMEHPAIASVYDAGTNEHGQPYFAMEYVDGAPITQYCDEHRLGRDGVLELFRSVCQAVHHAHQKGVVHRDLKPSNVLVTEVDGVPQPKVIDFGIAKATEGSLTDLSVLSIEGQMIGTPAYMSPEQAAGRSDVDTGTDVYALGALLYELLTGSAPYEAGDEGLPGLLRAIAETDPALPSQRHAGHETKSGIRQVPTDLDWITMRCLEKERSRRYASANDLAQDVTRFLASLPVEAAPPSTWYRLNKLARRHRLAVTAGVALVVALIAGAVGTGVGLVRAKRANTALTGALARVNEEADHARQAEARASEEARNAVAQGEIARAINAFFTDDLLASAVPSAERGRGRDVLLREVLDVASEGIEAASTGAGRLADKPQVEAAIRDTLGSVYAELGVVERAVRHLRRAVELRSVMLGSDHPETLAAKSELAGQLERMADYDAAEALLLPVLETQTRLLGDMHRDSLKSLHNLGILRTSQGRPEEAYELLIGMYERVADPDGRHGEIALALLNALSIAAQRSGRMEEAETYFRSAYELHREASGLEHPDTMMAMINLATFLRGQRRFGEAVEVLQGALEIQRELLGPRHPGTATALFNLGAALHESGRSPEAEELLREALGIYVDTFGPKHVLVYTTTAALAWCREAQGDREEAEALYRKAFEDTAAALGEFHPSTERRRRDLTGFLFQDLSRRGEVMELLEASLAAQREHKGPDDPDTLRTMENLGLSKKEAGELAEAEELLLEATAGLRARFGPDSLETLRAESSLVGVYLDMEEASAATDIARHTVEAGERLLPEDDYELARFRLRWGLVLELLGEKDEARAEFERAHASLVRTRGEESAMAAYAAQQLAEWAAAEE